jgi:hypothetical protein
MFDNQIVCAHQIVCVAHLVLVWGFIQSTHGGINYTIFPCVLIVERTKVLMTSDSSQKCFILGFNSQRHTKKTYGNQPKSQVWLTKINPHKRTSHHLEQVNRKWDYVGWGGAIRNSTSCMSIQWCKLPTLFRSTQIPLCSWDGIKSPWHEFVGSGAKDNKDKKGATWSPMFWPSFGRAKPFMIWFHDWFDDPVQKDPFWLLSTIGKLKMAWPKWLCTTSTIKKNI